MALEANPNGTNAESAVKKEPEIPAEDTFLLDKSMHCIVCDNDFKTKKVKNGRLRRLESDMDLRPRFQHIDAGKYDVVVCPYCGYAALASYFDHLSSTQTKLIKEQICSKYKPNGQTEPRVLDYDTAEKRYKLAYLSAVVKMAKASEKAYICLKLAWLLRGKYESLDPKDPKLEKERKECKEKEEVFYQQAYDGFMQAISTENYPMCGMDESTMDYLIATMSCHFEKYDVASKCIARIQGSANASKKVKDKALDLKAQIMTEMKKQQ